MPWDTEQLLELYDYLRWGDRLALDAAGPLGDEEYHKERGVSSGSIHKLLVHTMAAEWAWLARWRGEPPSRLEDHTDYPTRDALAARWPVVHEALFEFLRQQTPQTLAATLMIRSFAGHEAQIPLVETMIHVVDHATYHRGQLNAMIKQAGGTPAGVSYIQFQRYKQEI